MLEAPEASFNFLNFHIPEFSYSASEDPGTIKIEFVPRGTYLQKTGVFSLHLDFIGRQDDNEEKIIVRVKSIATFKFEQPLKIEELPDFFYNNAIAILFPYLRAFISNLTLQANAPLVLLNLMNLTGLSEPLKANTAVISD